MKNRWLRALLVAGALSLPTAAGAVPAHVTYTGELMADNGLPYSGTVGVVAKIFGGMTGGSPLWEQDLGDTSVAGGVLQLDLMDGALPALLGSSNTLWLEFEIDGETLEPRQRLTSVPYALVAGNAQMLGGMMPSDFVKADDGLDASQLPTDGINEVSNGALRNHFNGVSYTWAGGPVTIPDFNPPTPGANALAAINTTEGAGSYLTGVIVYTQFELQALSNVTLRLFPPAGSGVAPFDLQAGQLTPGTYTGAWNVGNAPNLAELIGKEVAGTWTVTVTDNDDTLSGGASVGQLKGFDITYDVVRANHLVVNGRLDVAGDINANGTVSFNALQFPDGPNWTRAPRSAYAKTAVNGCPAAAGVQQTITITTAKDALVWVTASGIYRGSSNADVIMRLNGNTIDRQYHNLTTTWSSITHTWTGTIPQGTHTFDVLTVSGLGGCGDYGGINVLIFE